MELDISTLSPMMQQYFALKAKYREHVLFFRLGDFYEMFFDDAKKVSKLLELTLTGRDCGLSERAPMCGVPYHAAEGYIKRLVELGEKVAICEQLTDPSVGKGIVERDVIKIVTPGTVTESSMLHDDKNNYIGAVYVNGENCSVCFADISTGAVSLFIKQNSPTVLQAEIINELARFSPAELLFNSAFLDFGEVAAFIKERLKCTTGLLDDICFSAQSVSPLLNQFSVNELSELGLDASGAAAAIGLFGYISGTQKAEIGRFTGINIFTDNKFMALDFTARRNLELIETMRNKEKRGTLLWVLDHTKTSMGKRLLRTYIEQPLIQPAAIMARLDAVEALCKKSALQAELSEELDKVYDLERLMTRVMYKTATPRDLKSLSLTALQLPKIKAVLERVPSPLLDKCNADIDTLSDISNLIENAVVDEPPAGVKDGGVIKDGFNGELDALRDIMNGGKDIISAIEEREKEKTGIKNLKVGFNRVFGYYIEITKSYYDLIPDSYIRKQTLANCERFITEELKEQEAQILGASEKALTLEAEIFAELCAFISSKLAVVQKTAAAVACLDVITSFAYVSMKNLYCKPDIAIDGTTLIKDGRHPVVELMLEGEMFVPNDTALDLSANRMAIITGPNMSGKSTYMRQVALITLMAQLGCFVPAESAKISIVDKIFTRVGASDDLTAGQSTFMVEMSEVADILKNATKNSLVILDEVGRGTSTFDGMSIARAVAEQISNSRYIGCKTLFATHYHELTALEDSLDGVKNYSVAVKKRGDDIKFLRKIVLGGADDSYGIEVAKLAGVPLRVINRAKELLSEMEAGSTVSTEKASTPQLSFGVMEEEKIIEKLRKISIDELTPDDAKEFLSDLVKLL